MNVRSMFLSQILLIVAVASSMVNFCAVPATADEPLDSLLHTLEWADKILIHSHDLEIVERGTEESERSDSVSEQVRIFRDVYRHDTGQFCISEVVGSSQFNVDTGDLIDARHSRISHGDKSKGVRGSIDSGINLARIACPQNGEGCYSTAHPLSLASMPITFNVPVTGGAKRAFDEVLDFLVTTKESSIQSVQVETEVLGKRKQVTRYRIFRMLKFSNGFPHPLLYTFDVSNSGADKGLVLRIELSLLKSEVTEFHDDSDIRYVERSVATSWETSRLSDGTEFVHPVQIRKHYAITEPVRENEIIVVTSLKWHKVEETSEKLLSYDEMGNECRKNIKRVDNMLNR